MVTMFPFISTVSVIFCVSSVSASSFVASFPKNVVAKGGGTMRIFGGTAAEEGQFPYMVFTLYSVNNQVASCSASLVAQDKVLLAAHCFENDPNPNAANALAVAGKADLVDYMTQRRKVPLSRSVDEQALGLQERRGAKVLLSPKLGSAGALSHDVALLVVERPFQLNSRVALIAISSGGITQRTTCTIQGWGLAEENRRSYRLMYVQNAHALPVTECQYKKKTSPFFCLQKTHSGICQGDSGSPAVCQGLVYGVASHVLTERADAECGDDLEEVYAALHLEEWLLPLLSSTTESSVTTAVPAPSQRGSGQPPVQFSILLLAASAIMHLKFFVL